MEENGLALLLAVGDEDWKVRDDRTAGEALDDLDRISDFGFCDEVDVMDRLDWRRAHCRQILFSAARNDGFITDAIRLEEED